VGRSPPSLKNIFHLAPIAKKTRQESRSSMPGGGLGEGNRTSIQQCSKEEEKVEKGYKRENRRNETGKNHITHQNPKENRMNIPLSASGLKGAL